MSNLPAIESWIATVIKHMPQLSKPQAVVLALWSFGMMIARSCGLSSVSVVIATLLGQKENTVRQRLREWYWDAPDKKGKHRRQLEVSTCFVPLLRWILSAWPAIERRLALAMDATSLADRFTVLVISVVYRACAIPVAWVVLPGNTPGAWKSHWLSLFENLRLAISPGWTVIVMADRGLYARWLYRHIVSLGWHPFLRINTGGKYRPHGESEFRPLSWAAPCPGSFWCGQIVCFKKQPLHCTLLAHKDEQHKDPWLIVTDLLPAQAKVFWYGLRTWIECGFKDIKRGGWQWQYTRMADPVRVARHWLAIAVATLWAVSLGGEADATLPASSFEELPKTHIARRLLKNTHSNRILSCFRRGTIVIVCQIVQGLYEPFARFYPEPWPMAPPAISSG
jgi:hypothetical protein